jgi:hypothetical protein
MEFHETVWEINYDQAVALGLKRRILKGCFCMKRILVIGATGAECVGSRAWPSCAYHFYSRGHHWNSGADVP